MKNFHMSTRPKTGWFGWGAKNTGQNDGKVINGVFYDQDGKSFLRLENAPQRCCPGSPFPRIIMARLSDGVSDNDVTELFEMLLGPERDFHGAQVSPLVLLLVLSLVSGFKVRPTEGLPICEVTLLLDKPDFPVLTFAGLEDLREKACIDNTEGS